MDIITYIKNLEKRIAVLESSNQHKKIKIPGGGKFVVNSESGDPEEGINGQIFYNTTIHKFRKFENGIWKNLEAA
jgi:hypothetical protein